MENVAPAVEDHSSWLYANGLVMSFASMFRLRPDENPALLLLLLFFVYAGVGLSGYGNDCDTYLMLKTGADLFEDGIYKYSRPPGNLIPELAISAAAILGGHVLSNLLSAILGTLSLYLFWLLCRNIFSGRIALLICALIGVNPYFVIASSSSMDYVYGIFFGLLGVFLLQKNWIFYASIFFAFAISSRLSNALLIGVIYLYFIFEAFKSDDSKMLYRYFLSGVVALLLAALLFVPSYIAAGNSFGFLTYAIGDFSYYGYISRFIYKNLALIGVAPLLLALALVLLNLKERSFSTWPTGLVFGFALLVAQELVFLKVPLEVSYLLPVLFVVFPIVFYVFRFDTRAAVFLILVTTVSSFVANIDFLDKKYNASGSEAVSADFGIFVNPGVVIADISNREVSEKGYFEGLNLAQDSLLLGREGHRLAK